MVRVFAVSGFKNSGKTTLCRKLIHELSVMGIKTGYVKRTSEDVFEDKSTDTAFMRDAGIKSVLWGNDGIRTEEKATPELCIEYVVSRYFSDAEIIILEGGKYINVPKIWVESAEPRPNDVTGVFMTYNRDKSSGDERQIAQKLAESVRGENYRNAAVFIKDRQLPMKDFIANFIRGAVKGMLSSLKGADADESIRIFITSADGCEKTIQNQTSRCK